MQPAFGLYTHIRANAFRSVLLIAGLFGLIYILFFGYNIILTALFDTGSFGYILHHATRSTVIMAPYITAGGVVWLVIGYYFNKKIISVMTGALPVNRKDEPELYNMLENMCMSRGMPMPTLSIIDTPELNAFASGLTREQYTVTVTSGLLECLEDDEIEAVLAHEVTHIRNHDVRLMVIAFVIVGMIGTLIEFMARTWFFSGGRGGSGRGGPNGALPAIIAGIAIIAGVWFLSQLMNFALSRRREYMADAGAVELTKNPDAMISALRKIEGCSDIEGLPSGMMEMCIDNPRTDFASWFATHPSVDDRVAALKKFAGGDERSATRQPGRSRIAERAAGSWEEAPASSETAADAQPALNPWSLETAVLVGGALETAQREDVEPQRRRQTKRTPWQTRTEPAPNDGRATPQPAAAAGTRGFASGKPRRQTSDTFQPEVQPAAAAPEHDAQPAQVWQPKPSRWKSGTPDPGATWVSAPDHHRQPDQNSIEPVSQLQREARGTEQFAPELNQPEHESPVQRLKRSVAAEPAPPATAPVSAVEDTAPLPPRAAPTPTRSPKLRRPAGNAGGNGFGKRPVGQFGRRRNG